MKQLIQFFIKELNTLRAMIAKKFDKAGGEINGDVSVKGETDLFGPRNYIGVGTATNPSKTQGVVRFLSNGTSKTDGAFIQYMPPLASNTGTNTTNTITISSASVSDLEAFNIKAKTTTLSGGLKFPASMYFTTAAGLSYGMDMNNSDIIGLNGLFFGDPTNASGEGLFFPKTAGTIAGDPPTYDKLDALNGELRINGNEVIQGNRNQRSFFKATSTIASTTSGGVYTFPFNVASIDNKGEFTTSTRRFYPSEAGLYLFNVNVKFKTLPQGTNVILHIRAYTSSQTERQFLTVYDNKNYFQGDLIAGGQAMIKLEKGDYVVVQYFSSEAWAGAISTSTAETFFQGVRLA